MKPKMLLTKFSSTFISIFCLKSHPFKQRTTIGLKSTVNQFSPVGFFDVRLAFAIEQGWHDLFNFSFGRKQHSTQVVTRMFILKKAHI